VNDAPGGGSPPPAANHQGEETMSIEPLKNRLPEYAKDLKLNLSTLAAETALSEQQKAGAFVTAAIAARNETVVRAIVGEFASKLSAEALQAAKAAAAIMGMNNIYYRFVHLTEAGDYKTMPAKLRMNIIAKPGVDKVDFELWALAASAINGCGMCMDSHERAVREVGVTPEAVQAVVRIAAVMHALAVTIEAETANPAIAEAA
jgi:alkyl hydroperoxide reductase subunit D